MKPCTMPIFEQLRTSMKVAMAQGGSILNVPSASLEMQKTAVQKGFFSHHRAAMLGCFAHADWPMILWLDIAQMTNAGVQLVQFCTV